MISNAIPLHGVLEMPIKWSHIKHGLSYLGAKNGSFFPDLNRLWLVGSEPAPDDLYSTLIQPRPDQVTHLQEWIADRAGERFWLAGRFGWRRSELTTEKLCYGVRVGFEDESFAVLARMTFG